MTSLNSEKNVFHFASLLIGAWLLGLAGESIYGPAMPSMATSLATTDTLIKLTITFFIFGKTISMLICSPLAEGFGRRSFILFGLFLFTLGGLICTVSPDIYVLLAGRFIQGVGCSITILMGRAVVNDNFNSNYAAKVFSYIFTGNAICIFLLPILGGYMATFFNWRWIFFFLTGYGSLIFFLVWKLLPKIHNKNNFASLKPKIIIQNYQTLIKNPSFWGFLLCVAFMMGGEKAFTTSSAFLFIHVNGYSKVAYGYLTAFMWGAHLFGTLFAGWIAFKAGIDRALTIGVVCIGMAAIAMFALGLANWNSVSLFTPIMFLYMLGTGFIMVSAAVGIVRPFPHLIGFATAFAMVLEFAVASAASFIISHHSASFIPLEKSIGMMGLMTLITWLLLIKKTKVTLSANDSLPVT